MATLPVTVLRTGTGWTVDVTNANLSSDLTLKDFVVLKGSPASVDNNANYTKTSRTVLTYTGSSVPANTQFEIRRSTPTSPIQTIQYAQRFSSGDFNNEIDRITRRAEEYALYGIGPGSVIQLATPLDTAFGVSWDGNIVNPPTMNAVYDYVSLLAPIASPAFTGVPTVPTASLATNTTQIASTAFVQGNLANYAPLASPTFTGTPAAPTATKTTNTTQLATTAFGHLASVAKKITQFSTTTSFTATGTGAYVNAWTTGSTTPRASTSSFLIIASVYIWVDSGSNGRVRLQAGSTTLHDTFLFNANNFGLYTLMGIYTPGSASSFTCKIDMNPTINGGNFRFNDTSGNGTATSIIEVIEFENTL